MRGFDVLEMPTVNHALGVSCRVVRHASIVARTGCANEKTDCGGCIARCAWSSGLTTKLSHDGNATNKRHEPNGETQAHSRRWLERLGFRPIATNIHQSNGGRKTKRWRVRTYLYPISSLVRRADLLRLLINPNAPCQPYKVSRLTATVFQ